MPTTLYRMYVDEVGDPGTSTGSVEQDPYLALTGVILEREYYKREFANDLSELKERYFSSDPDEPPVVLHRRDIKAQSGHFAVLSDPYMAQSFDQDVLHLIERTDYRLIAVVVDKKANFSRYGVRGPEQYSYALAALVARYCGYLTRVVGGVGDVYAEARKGRPDRDLCEEFRGFSVSGTRAFPGPTPLPPEVFQNALSNTDLTLRTKGDNTPGLQLADLLAHCCRDDVLQTLGGLSSGLREFERHMCSIIQRKYNRHEHTKKVEGYGKILVAPK